MNETRPRFAGLAEKVAKFCGGRFRASPAVGIDIGSHSIKIVCLRKSSENPSDFSARAGEVFLSSDCLQNKEIKDFDSVRSDLSFLCKDFGLKGKHAAVSISGGAVFTSKVKIPPSSAKSQKQIEDAVMLYLEQFFPEGADDYYCDFHSHDREPGEVLVAVAEKDTVDAYVSVLSASGFIPAVVDYDGFAIANAHCGLQMESGPGVKEVAVLLNVGRSVTNLAVLRNSVPVFTRDLSHSSEELTLNMAQAGDLTADEAELAKISLSASDNPGFLRAAREFAIGAALEVKSNLEFFLDCEDRKICRVFLSGGGSLVYGFRETFAETLRADVEYADPLGGVSAESEDDYLMRLSPKAAVAFGLALRMA